MTRYSDILSFYKEEMDGEIMTYIHDRANIEGKPAKETLHDVIDQVAAAVSRVRRVLGEGEARDAWERALREATSVSTFAPRAIVCRRLLIVAI